MWGLSKIVQKNASNTRVPQVVSSTIGWNNPHKNGSSWSLFGEGYPTYDDFGYHIWDNTPPPCNQTLEKIFRQYLTSPGVKQMKVWSCLSIETMIFSISAPGCQPYRLKIRKVTCASQRCLKLSLKLHLWVPANTCDELGLIFCISDLWMNLLIFKQLSILQNCQCRPPFTFEIGSSIILTTTIAMSSMQPVWDWKFNLLYPPGN